MPQAGVVAQVVVGALARAEQRDDAERAEVGQRVGGQVEQDRGLADVVAGDQEPTSR